MFEQNKRRILNRSLKKRIEIGYKKKGYIIFFYLCGVKTNDMLGVKSIHEPIKGEFAKKFLTDIIRMTNKRSEEKKKLAPKYKSGYVIRWK